MGTTGIPSRPWPAVAGVLLTTVVAGCMTVPDPGAGDPAVETYTVENPATGALLYVEVARPSDGGADRLPVVIMVPGGRGDSTLFTGGADTAQQLADAGYVVVTFDPDGRGNSTGEEDDGGYDQQDGLAAVIERAVTLGGVDGERVAVTTNSYGVTMATGALTRHPEMPVHVLIDWEGPADRDDTGGCGDDVHGHLEGAAACDDESYWSEREATTFVARLRIPYLRLQSETDHVQPDADHALKMVNAAVSGGVPHVQLNDLVVSEALTEIPDGTLLADATDNRWAQLYARYLAVLLP